MTGSANPFKEDNELIAHDQPFILFKLELPNTDKLLVPVRIKAASNSGARTANAERDSLQDVMIRIADYLTQLPEDFYKWRVESIVNLSELVAAVSQARGLKPDPKVLLNAKKVSESLHLKFICKLAENPELSFEISPRQWNMKEATDGDSQMLFGLWKHLLELSDNFEKFMNGVSSLPPRKEGSILKPFCVEVQNIALDSEVHELKYKTILITNLLEDTEIFDSPWKSIEEQGRKSTDEQGKHFSVNVFPGDDWVAFQRRVLNFSMMFFNGCSFKDQKVGLIPTDDKTIEKSILKFLTLPQPIWPESTLLLHQEIDPEAGTQLSHEKLQLFSKEDFDKFQGITKSENHPQQNSEVSQESTQKSKRCVLLRTQGDGCSLTGDVIKRILHHVAFLLPQQFGSLWIITGGTNKGIMKVHFSFLYLCYSYVVFSFAATLLPHCLVKVS